MKKEKYIVHVPVTTFMPIEVEAFNLEHAQDLGEEMYENGGLDHLRRDGGRIGSCSEFWVQGIEYYKK